MSRTLLRGFHNPEMWLWVERILSPLCHSQVSRQCDITKSGHKHWCNYITQIGLCSPNFVGESIALMQKKDRNIYTTAFFWIQRRNEALTLYSTRNVLEKRRYAIEAGLWDLFHGHRTKTKACSVGFSERRTGPLTAGVFCRQDSMGHLGLLQLIGWEGSQLYLSLLSRAEVSSVV